MGESPQFYTGGHGVNWDVAPMEGISGGREDPREKSVGDRIYRFNARSYATCKNDRKGGARMDTALALGGLAVLRILLPIALLLILGSSVERIGKVDLG